MTANKKPTKAEAYRKVIAEAMPEVKSLVSKYGRKAIGNCLAKIRAYDKEVSELAALERRVAEKRAKLK